MTDKIIDGLTPKQIEKFMSKVKKTDNCWIWTAYKNNLGYGRFCINGITPLAHRISYELFKGYIPQGLELDHLCRNPSCVNPDHLEAVTHKENMRRGNHVNQGWNYRIKTHCPQGHPYSGENLMIKQNGRGCRECDRTRSRKYQARKFLERKHAK